MVAGKVAGVPAGIYQYRSHTNELVRISAEDRREERSKAARNQRSVRAAVNIVISAVYERVTASYGERGVRHVHMEAGHTAQNISLQAVAINLGSVIGAFHDSEVKKIMHMDEREEPLYIIPVGKI